MSSFVSFITHFEHTDLSFEVARKAFLKPPSANFWLSFKTVRLGHVSHLFAVIS